MTVRRVALLVVIVGAAALSGAAHASSPARATPLDGSTNAAAEVGGTVEAPTTGVEDGTIDTDDVDGAVGNGTNSTATGTAALAENATDETVEAVADTTNGSVEAAANETNESIEAATDTTADTAETVTDGTDAVDDATDDVTGNVTGGIDDTTVDVAGEVTVESDVVGSASVEVSANATVEAGGGNETPAGGAADRPTTTEPATGSNATGGSNDAVGAAPPSGGSERGGDLPGTAGGVAAVGLTLAVGAGLLNRSAQVAAGSPAVAWDLQRLAATTTERLAGAPREWFRWLLGIGGYSRYDDSDPLAHETRAALHSLIEESPGVYLSEIAEAEGIPLSTARHHLRILESDTLVRSAMILGRRRYFPAGTDDPELEAALAEGTQAAILERLSRRGPASVSTLAEDLDRDASTITYHAQRLAEAGLLTRERDGQVVRNRLSPDVSAYFESGVASAQTD